MPARYSCKEDSGLAICENGDLLRLQSLGRLYRTEGVSGDQILAESLKHRLEVNNNYRGSLKRN
jgi:hypothetical protein